jgi:predicted peroxiredoxin
MNRYVKYAAISLWILLFLIHVAGRAHDHAASAPNESPSTHPRHLIVHLSSDEPGRVQKALGFGLNQHKEGTNVTIYLDDKGVRVGDRNLSGKFSEGQSLLDELSASGVDIIICPLGMQLYNVSEGNLLKGIMTGGKDFIPDFNEHYLFKPCTRVISW